MLKIFIKIGIILTIVIFSDEKTKLVFSADLKNFNNEILPIGSFLFTNHEPMRVGWFNWQNRHNKEVLQNQDEKPVGSLFVQLRPKKTEVYNQLAKRVLRDGTNQLQLIKNFNKGIELDHTEYLTIPFELLIGAIQGAALRNIFPYDRVEFGGWLHHFTYEWETPELIAKSFTKSNKKFSPKKNYTQGDKLLIKWDTLRSDLELRPLALRKPLFIKKDDNGVRYAFYRFKNGDTLYSSVVIRFIDNTKHFFRNKNTLYLLQLNGIKDAHQISKGQIIKIPLRLIKPEYFHYIPRIYRNYFDSNLKQNFLEEKFPENYLLRMSEIYSKNIISLRIIGS